MSSEGSGGSISTVDAERYAEFTEFRGAMLQATKQLTSAVDKLTGAVDELRTEYIAIRIKVGVIGGLAGAIVSAVGIGIHLYIASKGG